MPEPSVSPSGPTLAEGDVPALPSNLVHAASLVEGWLERVIGEPDRQTVWKLQEH